MAVDVTDVRKLIDNIFPQIRDLRRDIHKHPETSYEEVRTAKLVCAHLKKLGIPFRAKVGKTGVVALIQGKKKGPCVALRADMDALNMTEENTFAHASIVKGKMHACGHDGHTANLVGAAHVLAALRNEVAGSVKLLFQPAEEGGAGAAAMIADGALADPKPEVIYGLHADSTSPVGHVSMKPGPVCAAGDRLVITVRGKGCHAAYPHRGVDPVVISAAVIQALQTIVSRRVKPADPVVVTVATIHGGSASNVIPPQVDMTGTFRTYEPKVRKDVAGLIRKLAVDTARTMGGAAEVKINWGYPPTINEPKATAFLEDLAVDLLGRQKVHVMESVMGAEDFSYYVEKVPGTFFRLGVGKTAPGHSPTYDFNDEAMRSGMLVMSMAAVRWLERQG